MVITAIYRGLKRLFVLLILVIVADISVAKDVCSVSDEARHTRPNPQQGPTLIDISIFIIDISDINDHAQNFTADVVVEQRWQDSRLAVDRSVCRLDLNAIWHPEVYVFNQQKVESYLSEHVYVTPDGTVSYVQRFYGTFGNTLDMRDFPFDQQRLPIKLVSFFESSDVQLRFNDKLTGQNDQLSIAGWYVSKGEISLFDFSTRSSHTADSEYSFSQLQYVMTAIRDVNYYRWKAMLPLILIVVMSWIVFWIDPSQLGPQLAMAATAMLTLIAFLFSLTGILPPVSYLTRMDYFVYGSLALVFLTSLEALVTSKLYLHGREKLARRFDYWSRGVFPLFFVLLIWQFWI